MRLLIGCIVAASLAAPAYAQILKQEPPMGKLMPGVKVLVDNGKCPKGQIQEVTGLVSQFKQMQRMMKKMGSGGKGMDPRELARALARRAKEAKLA